MSACAITVEHVGRAFGATRALEAVSIHPPPGKVTALLGASGSGKSTLLRIVAGLEPLDAGRVALDGVTVSAPGVMLPAERRRMGFVFQDFALFPHMTALDNVAFGVAGERGARHATARQWLDRVGLAARADAFPHQLSGGEQQRVALARALAPAPRAVLLDEPFSGLDPSLRAQLRDVTLDALAALGATTLFVTHDADEALYVADHIVILKSGRVVQEGAPRAVYADPASPDAAAALGPVNRHAGLITDGVFATPFGAIRTDRTAGAGCAVVRAEAVRFVPGDVARVLDRRPQGPFDLVRIAAGGVVWRALTPAGDGPEPGAATGIALDPTGAFVFPDQT